MKKITSLILSIITIINIFCALGITVSAETSGDFKYSITDNNATITGYYGSATELIIPSQLDGYTVTSIGNSAFSYKTKLKSVTIPDSVTSIGNRAFVSCTINSITIPNSVTSIGESAFYDTSLKSVTIPNSVTSIGRSAFKCCTGLMSVKIYDIAAWCNIEFSDYESNPLYEAQNLYLNDTLVTDLTIPDGVTSICNYAFCKGTCLNSVTIPGSVTSIGKSAFFSCTSLNGVTIPDSVTSIDDFAFDSCKSLNSVTIPDSVTSIGGYAFYSCNSLTSVTIGNSVTSIGGCAFWSCKSLTSVTIPDSVTSIGKSAFSYCTSLTSVTIPDSVTTIGEYAFNGCTSLSNIYVDSNNKNYTSLNGNLFNKDKTELIQYAVGKTDEFFSIPSSVTSIGDLAFDGCKSLMSITIPNNVTSIGKYAFKGCTSLTNIYVDSNNKNYTSVNGNLYNKNKTEVIQYAVGKTDEYFSIPSSVTSIGAYAFYNCTNLKSITIPDSVTSIGDGAFYECTKLIAAVVPIDFRDLNIYNFFPSTTEIRYREKVFKIYYDANGGIDAPEQLLFTSDSKTSSFTVTKQIPLRTGCVFEGWSEEPNGSADYLPGKTYTISNSITLYAVWRKKNTYTIKYELCGGESNIPSQIKTEGIDLKLSSIKPTHAKYTFAYWISSDKQTTYSAGSSYKADANDTLYAVWKEACSKCHGSPYSSVRCDKCNGSKYSSIRTCASCNGKGKLAYSYTCNSCNGTGTISKTSTVICPLCNGNGWRIKDGNFEVCYLCSGTGEGQKTVKETCKTCGGDGECVSEKKCSLCNGSGERKTICDKCEGTGIIRTICDKCNGNNSIIYHYPIIQFVLGDVDGDGEIEIRDSTWIQRHVTKEEMPFVINKTTADVDGDGIITVMDATAIQYYLANMKTSYKIGEKIE